MQTLSTQLTQVIANGTLNTALTSGSGLSGLMSVSSTLLLVNAQTTTSTSSSNTTGMIIGIVLGVTVAICLAVVGTICYIRRRAKITQIGNAS